MAITTLHYTVPELAFPRPDWRWACRLHCWDRPLSKLKEENMSTHAGDSASAIPEMHLKIKTLQPATYEVTVDVQVMRFARVHRITY